MLHRQSTPHIVTKTTLPPLLYADTGSNTDQLYFSRVQVHDPFIAFGSGKKRITVQSALEYGRIVKARSFDQVLPLEKWADRARKAYPDRKIGPAEVIAELAKAHRVPGFRVADDFPAALFVKLCELGIRIELTDGPLFPEREIKSAKEAAAIREGNRLSSIGFSVVEDILKRSRIRQRELILDGKPLTSERVLTAIEIAILTAGGRADNTIVAGGNQGCDPHERGHGLLRPNEMIIVDIFPRVIKTGYFGDMTRTYLKGRASEAQRKLYTTVHQAQQAAIKAVRTGVDGRDVHQQVLNVFDATGYETKRGKTGSVGFFHGTGHGLGVAIHEPPRVSAVSHILQKGSVVTIEPGLYYPGLGGCRIEDVVQVTDRGAKLLSSHHYEWEIK
jgi:Xaa-Pro aminopeptidase